jgi:hypothetical protein
MTATRTNMEFRAPAVIDTMYQRSLGVAGLFGVASLVLAMIKDTRDAFFHAYLVGFMLWLGATLGSMAILMIQHMTGGKWGMVIRRQLEAATRTLPLMALLFIPIAAAGMEHLYGAWLHPDPKDKHLMEMSKEYLTRGGTAQFLFLDGFIARAIVYFAIWFGIIFILNRWSDEQDNPPMQNLSPRFRKIAAPGLILYAFTISFAVIDWVMSLDPHWISTIFGFIFIVGELLTAISLMVVIERILMKYEPASFLLKPKEVHDHGKLMLTFIMLWAYFSFSQLLIIWAGNLPSEITFFTRRLYSGWQAVALALVVFHFAVPFLLLLSRAFKREARTLVWLASWMIFMRFVDLYWYIEPNFSKTVHVNWLVFVVPVAIGGLWMATFLRNLKSRPLLPAYDMHAQEFLEYVGVGHD